MVCAIKGIRNECWTAGLLDDVAAIAKVAAASLDDVAARRPRPAQGGGRGDRRCGGDAQLRHRLHRRPRTADHLAIAMGSIRNKLLFLLPAALALSFFAPWADHPAADDRRRLSLLRGRREGLRGAVPARGARPRGRAAADAADPKTLEDEKVAGAIQTDFILSAEIMAIALAALPDLPFWEQALVLAVVALGITVGVYGAVALIVKADDFGLALAPASGRDRRRPRRRPRHLIAMPWVMQTLSIVGTAAMIWVGGGIVVHGLAGFGLDQIEHLIEAIAHGAEAMLPALGGFVEGLATILADLVFGLALGLVLIPIAGKVIGPAWKAIRGCSAASPPPDEGKGPRRALSHCTTPPSADSPKNPRTSPTQTSGHFQHRIVPADVELGPADDGVAGFAVAADRHFVEAEHGDAGRHARVGLGRPGLGIVGILVVEPDRRGGGAGEPVDHEVGQELSIGTARPGRRSW